MSAATPARSHAPPPDELSLLIPSDATTLDGFLAWVTSPGFPERIRVSFMDGEVFLEMSNEDPELHVMVKGIIYATLLQHSQSMKLGRLYQDGMLLTNRKANLASNPDATFVKWETLRAGRVRLVRRQRDRRKFRDMEGSPDWVLEVVSDSSEQVDTRQLRLAYHRARIAEYWIVDARGDDVVLQVLHWRKTRYVAAPVKDGWQRSRVFGREFRLTRKPAELGLWDYTLETR